MTIDGPTILVLVGSTMQAVEPGRRVAGELRARAVAILASLRDTPLPPADPELDALIDRI